ncbi:MAG: hypothetical protein GEV07_26540 [Streptosporangiales bacterium]|nr:hypothetical protein [Streptosporangiales bacterium]
MLLDSLVDDAAVFPPGNATMPSAVDGYLRYSGTSAVAVLGRFLCPASRLPECAADLADDIRLAVGVVADTGARGIGPALDFAARTHRLVVQAVEVALPADAKDIRTASSELVALLPVVDTYVEVPRKEGWREALDVLAEHGRYAKLRTGGAAGTVPPAAGVAAFITACIERSLPFKCTAGLHHAVRWQDPTLGWHHGFVNLLAAVHAALSDGSSGAVVDALELTRTDALLAALPQTDDERKAVRAVFHGFGSCNINDPITDLQRLGLLPS